MAERDKSGKFKPKAETAAAAPEEKIVATGNAEEVIDDTADTEAPTDTKAPGKRGRGRPRDPKKDKAKASEAPRRSKTRTKGDTTKLANKIVGVHLMAATMTGLHELAVSHAQAAELANDLTDLADEFGLGTIFSGKVGAFINLASTLGMIYGPRVWAISRRAQAYAEAQARGPQAPAGASQPGVYDVEAEKVTGENVQQ